MVKCRSAIYRVLTVLTALYGMMSACICMDHVSPQSAMPACHHCASSQENAVGAQIASYHQCCGMERAPIAIEKLTLATPIMSDLAVVVYADTVFPDIGFRTAALSNLLHAPPGDIPIYLTTHRFVI